jgi:hypothetical protein
MNFMRAAFAWLVTAGVIAGGLTGAYYKIRSNAMAARDAFWQSEMARERERIAEANLAALGESRRRIAELDLENEKLEHELRNAEEEARRDRNAADRAIGVDGVRRLNRIH